jgi:hypothetical protein
LDFDQSAATARRHTPLPGSVASTAAATAATESTGAPGWSGRTFRAANAMASQFGADRG